MEWLQRRVQEYATLLARLLDAPKVPFDERLRSQLPEQQGLYAIATLTAAPGECLRAGTTKRALGGLRQRIYQNHLMGNQDGNLRSQLVREGTCNDLASAKLWMRKECLVQWIVVEDTKTRALLEHFMLAVLQPKYCD